MAIQKLTGSETEYVQDEEFPVKVDGVWKKKRRQGYVPEIVSLMKGFQRKHPTLPIKGRREMHNIRCDLERPEHRAQSSEQLRELERAEKMLKLLSGVNFDPTEGLATASGAIVYLEAAGICPEGSTPPCTVPSEVILQERMLDCSLARVAREISTDKVRYHLYRSSSDCKGNSRGLHTSVMIAEDCRSRLYARRYDPRRPRHYTVRDLSREMQDLMTWVVLRLWTIGPGKPGSEHPDPDLNTHYQISQRSDFITGGLIGGGTTHERPLINCRDESLADNPYLMSRFHDIHSEGSNRSTRARKLSIGLTQVVLAMIEDDMFKLEWYLEDPLRTVHLVSRDLTLSRPIPVVLRRNNDIVEKMPLELLSDIAKRMKMYAAVAPLHKELLDCIGEFERIIGLFAENSPELSRILDWKIKEKFIRLKMERMGLNPDNPRHWQDPRVEELHIKYHCLTDERLWKAVVRVCKVKDAEKYFEENIPDVLFPPDTTSAFLKGFLVTHPFLSQLVDIYDWHVIEAKIPGLLDARFSIDPRFFHKAEVEELRRGLGMIDTPELAHEFFSRITARCQEPTHRLIERERGFMSQPRRVDDDDDDDGDNNDRPSSRTQPRPSDAGPPQITQLRLYDIGGVGPRGLLERHRYGDPDRFDL